MRKPHALRVMIARAKALLDGAESGIDWRHSVWDVTRWLPQRAASAGVRHLFFTLPDTKKRSGRVSLAEPFADFAKALVVLIWARSRIGSDQLNTCALALRYLFVVLAARGTAAPWALRPEDFSEALARYERKGVSAGVAHRFAYYLERIAEEADYFGITAVALAFKNPIPAPLVRSSRCDLAAGRRAHEAKLPTLEALAAYAQCTNDPLNDDERILLRAADLHIALGARIGETLTIPLDCWIEEEVRNAHGEVVREGPTGAPLKRYGIRYYPEKGYDLAIDWLADQDVPLARRAVAELTELCAPARAIARWLKAHPGKLWDYPPGAVLPVSEFMRHLRYANEGAFCTAMRGYGIAMAKARRAGAPAGESAYRAGDIERVFMRFPQRLDVITGERGRVILNLSVALCVKFDGQFSFTHRFRNLRRPLLITTTDINKALGGHADQSVFDRRAMTIEDADGGGRRIRMNSHSTRHWKNALYDVGGMTDLQQTWAMHRKDVRQTRVYQHRTIGEQTDIMRRFLELSFNERKDYLREAIADGKVAGPLADAYRTLKVNAPTDAETFLQTYAAGVHITPWGICANDFTLSPCRKYLQCYDNCRHYHRTADPDEQRRLEDLRAKMQSALQVMRQNAIGEAGADKWVAMLETKLGNLERVLAMVPQEPEAKRIQVFPRGVDRARVSPPTRSVL